MKNEVLYLLLNNYADHEAVFLSSMKPYFCHLPLHVMNVV